MAEMDRPVDPTGVSLTHYSLGRIGQELRDSKPYEKVGKNSRSLVRSQDLSMIVLALKAGGELKQHHAPGPATLIVLEGEIVFADTEQERVLGQFDSVVFSSELEHSVRGRRDALLALVIGYKAKSS